MCLVGKVRLTHRIVFFFKPQTPRGHHPGEIGQRTAGGKYTAAVLVKAGKRSHPADQLLFDQADRRGRLVTAGIDVVDIAEHGTGQRIGGNTAGNEGEEARMLRQQRAFKDLMDQFVAHFPGIPALLRDRNGLDLLQKLFIRFRGDGHLPDLRPQADELAEILCDLPDLFLSCLLLLFFVFCSVKHQPSVLFPCTAEELPPRCFIRILSAVPV